MNKKQEQFLKDTADYFAGAFSIMISDASEEESFHLYLDDAEWLLSEISDAMDIVVPKGIIAQDIVDYYMSTKEGEEYEL